LINYHDSSIAMWSNSWILQVVEIRYVTQAKWISYRLGLADCRWIFYYQRFDHVAFLITHGRRQWKVGYLELFMRSRGLGIPISKCQES